MNVLHSLLKSNVEMVIENKNEDLSDLKKNNMPELNVLHAIKPFNFIYFLFAIQRISYDQNKIAPRSDGSKVYAVLFIIFVAATSAYGFIIKISRELKPGLSSNITQNIGDLFLCCSGILSLIITNLVSSKHSLDQFYNIVYVDRQLSLPQECYVRKGVFLTFFSFFLYLVTVLVGDFVAWHESNIFMYIAAYVNMCILDLIVFQYLMDIWIVTFRLRILVAQLVWCNNVKLYVKEDSHVDFDPHNMIYIKSWKQIKGVVSKSNIWDSFGDRILRLTSVYDKLADNADIINTTYGIQILLIVASCLLSLLMGINSMFNLQEIIRDIHGNITLAGINWCLHYLVLLIITIIFTEAMKYENKRGVIVINKLILGRKMTDRHCDRLMLLEGLMKSRPFVATAGGLFPVDCTLLYTFVATIATYTVILYQMKD